jgi:hypothetical protein
MRILRHVNNKDFKKTRHRHLDEQKFLSLKIREQEILEQQEIEQIKKISSPLKSDWKSELLPEVNQEIQKEEVKVSVKVPEKLKSDWRKELAEGMTTGGQEIQFAPSDVPLDTIDAADPASFTAANGGFDSTFPQDGLMGATIVSNGTGSGNNGGFNLGKSYLSFNGTGYDLNNIPGLDNTRAVILTPFDSTRATTLEITAIVGNGSNGGEAPGVGQDITLWYTDPNGDFPNSLISAYDEENYDQIIAVPYNGSGSVRTYSVTIPSYLRKSGISFVLLQSQGSNPSLTGDNYGITEIKLKRTTPVSVVAPLDSPEAVSFFRVGTGPNVETPEQRYRRITQQLLASKNYTNQMFGSNYPGSNFSGISGVVQPPTWEQAARATAAPPAPAQPAPKPPTPAPKPPIPAPGTDDYYYKLGGGDYSLQLFQKQGHNKTRQDIIDRGKKLLASNQKDIANDEKRKAALSKSTSGSTTTGKTGSTQQPKPPTQQPKLDKFGRQIGTPLPPGVMQDMLKGGKTASPVGDAAIMAASALAARGGLNALKSGGASPKPPTPAPKPPTPAPKPPTPNQRVQNFNARMDAARNPNTGGYRDILKPQQGPTRSSGGKR